MEDDLKGLVQEYSEMTRTNKFQDDSMSKGIEFDLNKSAPNLKGNRHLARAATEIDMKVKPRNQQEKKDVKAKNKNYKAMVELECRCKLAQYKLDSQVNVVKDAYL